MNVCYCREQLLRLVSDNVELQGFLKEQQSTEPKEKASTDASGNSSDEQAELKQSVEKVQADSKGHFKLLRGKQDKDLKKSKESNPNPSTTQVTVSAVEAMKSSQTENHTPSRSVKQHVAKHGVRFVLEK